MPNDKKNISPKISLETRIAEKEIVAKKLQ